MIKYPCVKCQAVMESPQDAAWDGTIETCPVCGQKQVCPKPHKDKCGRCGMEVQYWDLTGTILVCPNCGLETRYTPPDPPKKSKKPAGFMGGSIPLDPAWSRDASPGHAQRPQNEPEPEVISTRMVNKCSACGYETAIDNIQCPKCEGTYFVKCEKFNSTMDDKGPAPVDVEACNSLRKAIAEEIPRVVYQYNKAAPSMTDAYYAGLVPAGTRGHMNDLSADLIRLWHGAPNMSDEEVTKTWASLTTRMEAMTQTLNASTEMAQKLVDIRRGHQMNQSAGIMATDLTNYTAPDSVSVATSSMALVVIIVGVAISLMAISGLKCDTGMTIHEPVSLVAPISPQAVVDCFKSHGFEVAWEDSDLVYSGPDMTVEIVPANWPGQHPDPWNGYSTLRRGTVIEGIQGVGKFGSFYTGFWADGGLPSGDVGGKLKTLNFSKIRFRFSNIGARPSAVIWP